MDLPMGLRKFAGDERLPRAEEVDAMVKAIEDCNKHINSILFCLCHHSQLGLVADTVRKHGYTSSQPMVFHKQWKSDKAPGGGFISACLFGVVAFKNRTAVFGSTTTPQEATERLQWLQNHWTSVRPTPAQTDDDGRPINECPQDPMIPERFITMFRTALGPNLCVFSSGESSGWVAPVCLRLGVDCICTEKDPYPFFYLHQRLMREAGALILKAGQDQEGASTSSRHPPPRRTRRGRRRWRRWREFARRRGDGGAGYRRCSGDQRSGGGEGGRCRPGNEVF